MTTPETLDANVSGERAADTSRECEETVVVMSDQHLGEGEKLRYLMRYGIVRRILRWFTSLFVTVAKPPMVEVPNPLEDFPDDGLFVAQIDAIVGRYGSSDILRLMLLGDCFDPLAVTFRGKFKDPPFEFVGVYKMKKIIRGHRRYFDKLAEFIRLPNARLDIFVGNHDLFLVWPAVQAAILDRVAGNDEALRTKVRFVDQSMGFRLAHRGVVYDHGMNSEPQNTADPGSVIQETLLGIKLKRPKLALPPGSIMTVEVVNNLKLRNYLVGRSTYPKLVWKNAALHRWGWVAYAAVRLFWFVFTWTLRDFKHRWPLTVRMVFSTIADDSVDRYAERILRTTEGCRAVVCGHSHEPRRITTEAGTYVNTGTQALQYRIVDPKFVYRWKRFRWVEFQVRAIEHLFRTGEIPFARQFSKVIGYVALMAGLAAFLVMSIPKAWRLGSYHVQDFKLPMGILLVFLALTGIIRFFAGKPEIRKVLNVTFGLTRHFRNGDLKVELMEFDSETNAIRECV